MRALELTDRVRFVGRVEGGDKIYLLQNAIATVMPSRVWEAFPLALLESYAAGKAVIGSGVPGIADLVQDGRTGLLVPEQNVEALAGGLVSLLNAPDRAAAMGEAARQIAASYSWESVARRHIELYEQLIAGIPFCPPTSAHCNPVCPT
jgi:glycosyltransferase involved in cell wall biosynthesis